MLPLDELGVIYLFRWKILFSSFFFLLTISYHFHLENIKKNYFLHLWCDLHLFRSKTESYLSWEINYLQFIKEKCRLTNMIFYTISYHFHFKNIKFLHLFQSTCDLYLLRFIIESYFSLGINYLLFIKG